MEYTVIGFGSLLDQDSARRTAPSLQNFREVYVPDYRRIFNKVAAVFFERFDSTQGDLDVGALATRYELGGLLHAVAFEVDEKEFLGFQQREHRYLWRETEFTEIRSQRVGRGLICTEWSDLEYRANRCCLDEDYYERVGRLYQGQIWRQDILPQPIYLNHCLSAARSLSEDAYQNFVEHTLLADGETRLIDYLRANTAVIKANKLYDNR